MDRENDDLCVSAGRSGSFRGEGCIPVLSVMPLGRVCGRDPLCSSIGWRPRISYSRRDWGLECHSWTPVFYEVNVS